MKVVKELGMLYPKENSPKKYRYVIALCESCSIEVKLQTRVLSKQKYCNSCSKSLNSTGHKMSNTRIYKVWNGMKGRCANHKDYAHVTVCEEWANNPTTFIEWAMENGYDTGKTIDRIDGTKGYEPSNCRWTTKTVQAQNQKAIQKNNTSGYRGVSENNKYGGFNAYVANDGKTKNLGRYCTAKDAAIVYDNWHRNEGNVYNTLNFPAVIYSTPSKAVHPRYSNKSHFETKVEK